MIERDLSRLQRRPHPHELTARSAPAPSPAQPSPSTGLYLLKPWASAPPPPTPWTQPPTATSCSTSPRPSRPSACTSRASPKRSPSTPPPSSASSTFRKPSPPAPPPCRRRKTPDLTELIRGKSARLVGSATTLAILIKGLPLAYNKDLQEGQEPVFDAADTIAGMLSVLPAIHPRPHLPPRPHAHRRHYRLPQRHGRRHLSLEPRRPLPQSARDHRQRRASWLGERS